MDPAMTQFLASQLGITAENGELQPQDIAMALASRGADPMMASMIAQMAGSKPALDDEPGGEEVGYEREIQHLKKIIQRLRRDVASAKVMAQFIANTFGTCPACWGLNRFCQQCGGQGRPGYIQPNLEELRAWVEPALKKGGLHIEPSLPQTT